MKAFLPFLILSIHFVFIFILYLAKWEIKIGNHYCLLGFSLKSFFIFNLKTFLQINADKGKLLISLGRQFSF